MARFSKQFIKELNLKENILDLISAHVPLQQRGKYHVGLCPFHNEKTPSFTVSTERNSFYCFGCHEKGSPLDFLIKYHKLGFIEAIEKLAKRQGIKLPTQKTDRIQIIFDNINKFCQEELRKNTQALQYLKSRSLSISTINFFSIGFMPMNSIKKILAVGKCSKKDLIDIGIINPQSNKNRFSNRVLIPIKNKMGYTVGYGGRSLQDNIQPKYINSPETNYFKKGELIYGLDNISNQKHLILVEGYMDVIGLYEQKIQNAIAILGTSISPLHIEKLIKIASRVTICFDGDVAGNKAAYKAALLCLPFLGPFCQFDILQLPNEHDPDSYTREYGRENFIAKLKRCSSIYDIIYQNILGDNKLETAQEKSKFRHEIMQLSSKIKDKDFKNEFITGGIKLIREGIIVDQINFESQSSWVDQLIQNIVKYPKFLHQLELIEKQQLITLESNQRDLLIVKFMSKAILEKQIITSSNLLEECKNDRTLKKLKSLLENPTTLSEEEQFSEFKRGIEKINKIELNEEKSKLLAQSKIRSLTKTERDRLLEIIDQTK